MADKITINFAANTEDVEAGADRMKDSLKDTQGALDDVGQSGQDAGEKIVGVGDSADDSSNKLANLGSVGKQALEGDVGGAAQSAAGLLSDLGPVAALAGTVAAVGLGAITKSFEDQQKAADELKKRIADAYKSAAQDGREFLDEAQIDAAALDILFDTGKREAAAAAARRIGVDQTTYIRAQAGDQEALNFAIDQTIAKIASLGDEIYGRYKGLSLDESRAIDAQLVQLKGLAQQHADNSVAAAGYADVVTAGESAQQAQIQKTSAANVARYQALEDAVNKANGLSVNVPANLDTRAFDRDMDALLRKPRAVNVIAKYGAQVP